MNIANTSQLVARSKTLARPWALLLVLALVAVVAYAVAVPSAPAGIVTWLFPASVSVLPPAALVLGVLTLRYVRQMNSSDITAGPAPLNVAAKPAAKPTILYSLDEALGVPQMQELRAHVELLCTMATLDRMGPDLTRRLRLWGVPARAQQAAISAEILQRLLSVPGLEPVLHRCALLPGTSAFAHVQADLQAIAVALHLLGQQVQGDPPPASLVQSEIEASETLMGNLPPVDRVLVQYSQLLTAVAAMARILATSYEQLREGRFGPAVDPKRVSALRPAEGGITLVDALDLPRWKLN